MNCKILNFSFCILFLTFLLSCGEEIQGEKDIGNNFKLIELSKNKSVLVYCISEGLLGCNSSYDVVPNNIKDLSYNEKWIIAKSNQVSKNYWLVNKAFKMDLNNCDKLSCDSILKSNIKGPLDSLNFYNTLRLNNINLNFKN